MLKNLRASQKILISFCSIAGLAVIACGSITLLIFGLARSADEVGAGLAPLVDAAMEIKLNGAAANLLMEEIMAGNTDADMSDVLSALDEARFYATSILDGGTNDEGTFLPSDDPAVRESISRVLTGLEAFALAAESRWALLAENTGVGSGADEEFDALYDDLTDRILALALGKATPDYQHLAGDARYLLAHGHLLVAEILGGDLGEDFGEATGSFDAAAQRLEEIARRYPGSGPAIATIRPGVARLRDLAVSRYDRALARAELVEQADLAFDQSYDDFIAQADAAETKIQAAMANGIATQRSLAQTAEIVAVVFGILLLALMAVFYKWLDGTLGRRMRLIADAMEKITNGDFDGMPPDWGTTDEVGQLRGRVDDLRQLFQRQKELERAAAREREIAEQGQAEAEAMRQAAEEERAVSEESRKQAELRAQSADAFSQAFARVVDAAGVGDLSVRIDTQTGQDDLDRLGVALNDMLGGFDANLQHAMDILDAIARGDLRQQMTGEYHGIFARLQQNTNAMTASLQALIGNIAASGDTLSTSSMELRDTSDSLSRQAEQNAVSLEETSAALEELSASIRQVSDNVSEANENARIARETAQSSDTVAGLAADAMNRIAEASKEISNVVNVINEIAFQINLLALNAGVEAARAGDAGRGFSVVASEVRQLAQRASEAARGIETVIAQSDSAVAEGVAKVDDARTSLGRISESVVEISNRIDQVASAIGEQVHGVSEITTSVAQIDQNTQKQVAAFEEVTAASAILSDEANGLRQATARFKISDQTTEAAARKNAAA